VSTPAETRRTLSTAEDRRESVLAAAERICAAKGLYGTPTMEVAKAAGISQAYLFRLFPTKDDLALAVVQRSNGRIRDAFAAAAARAKATGGDVFEETGQTYVDLIADRDILLIQLHAHTASITHEPIRDAMRASFAELYELVAEASGADDEELRGFFATGMLLNTMAALDAFDLPDRWAVALGKHDDDC